MLSAEQLSMRHTGIGASEIGTIAGLNPYASPHDLWLVKRGLVTVEENEAMELGNLLEEPIAKAYARRNPDVALRPSDTIRHPSVSWAFATPDRDVFLANDFDRLAVVPLRGAPPLRLLECKSAGRGTAHEWGDGEDEIPPQYLAQVQWQMEVTGVRECDVAALVAGKLRFYRTHLDPVLVAGLLEIGEAFWKLVQDGSEPALDARDSTKAWLASRFPRVVEQLRAASPEEAELVRLYVSARNAETAAKEEKERLGNELRARIGAAEGMAFKGGKATWKAPAGSTLAWSKLLEELNPPAELVAKYSKPSERKLDVRLTKEGK